MYTHALLRAQFVCVYVHPMKCLLYLISSGLRFSVGLSCSNLGGKHKIGVLVMCGKEGEAWFAHKIMVSDRLWLKLAMNEVNLKFVFSTNKKKIATIARNDKNKGKNKSNGRLFPISDINGDENSKFSGLCLLCSFYFSLPLFIQYQCVSTASVSDRLYKYTQILPMLFRPVNWHTQHVPNTYWNTLLVALNSI